MHAYGCGILRYLLCHSSSALISVTPWFAFLLLPFRVFHPSTPSALPLHALIFEFYSRPILGPAWSRLIETQSMAETPASSSAPSLPPHSLPLAPSSPPTFDMTTVDYRTIKLSPRNGWDLDAPGHQSTTHTLPPSTPTHPPHFPPLSLPP